MADDDIHIKPNQFSSKFGGAVAWPHGVAEVKRDILAFRTAKSM
jgi:hypothetical protein